MCINLEPIKRFCDQRGFWNKALKNERTRVIAKCIVKSCPWRIHASFIVDTVTYMMKTMEETYNGVGILKKSNATSTWIAQKLSKRLKWDLKIKLMARRRKELRGTCLIDTTL